MKRTLAKRFDLFTNGEESDAEGGLNFYLAREIAKTKVSTMAGIGSESGWRRQRTSREFLEGVE
jgi:hypothetical protein